MSLVLCPIPELDVILKLNSIPCCIGPWHSFMAEKGVQGGRLKTCTLYTIFKYIQECIFYIFRQTAMFKIRIWFHLSSGRWDLGGWHETLWLGNLDLMNLMLQSELTMIFFHTYVISTLISHTKWGIIQYTSKFVLFGSGKTVILFFIMLHHHSLLKMELCNTLPNTSIEPYPVCKWRNNCVFHETPNTK